MAITGIDRLDFGVEDVQQCTSFLNDWGLSKQTKPVHVTDAEAAHLYETLDGGQICLSQTHAVNLPPAFETGSTLRRAVFGVDNEDALATLTRSLESQPTYAVEQSMPSITDLDGLRLSFRVSRRRDVELRSGVMNTAEVPDARTNQRSPVYSHASPVKIGHYVLFSADVTKAQAFYTDVLGFVVSDYYPGAGYFLRCSNEGGHHNVFLLQTPDRKIGLNHVAFTVRDIHEVFGGGLHVSRQGWSTQIGPGRHPISSAYFWYVESPTGGLFEYYADEDWCTSDWEAKSWERTPEHYAEWAIAGGIDGHSRRQSKD